MSGPHFRPVSVQFSRGERSLFGSEPPFSDEIVVEACLGMIVQPPRPGDMITIQGLDGAVVPVLVTEVRSDWDHLSGKGLTVHVEGRARLPLIDRVDADELREILTVDAKRADLLAWREDLAAGESDK